MANPRPKRQTLSFRPLQESDFAALPRLTVDEAEAALVYWECSEPGKACAVRDLLRSRQDVTVAELQGRVVALGALYEVEESRQGYLGPLVVDPDLRNHGVGSELMEHLLDIAFRKYRLREVRVRLLGENEDGIMLCSEMGFLPYSNEEHLGFDGRRHVVVQMRINRKQLEDLD
ncbi:GNAT family N-acetyltransferase [Thioalkalivibrio sulfidiphilus]|uniref:GCN5-related N-acetyltransferase n=1 Tax=Thioalkalivibrio sulfidiphilus (strain HL-EbGR7) TaxID=396588 RepID=B8GRQ7_THISH|nr:GNAT family N-acetyltransferase [Thioalkalivibrio sulfidiphilus]ACL72611.1 GCN5-related N-acetyltransferase [Thioalkalivibrio sulfidiphilus HL-EbGr7]